MMESFELEMLCTLVTRFSVAIAGKPSKLVFKPSTCNLYIASIVILIVSSELSYHCQYSVCWAIVFW